MIEVIVVWGDWDGNWDQTFLLSSSSGNNKVTDTNRLQGYGNKEKAIKKAGSTFVRDQTQNVKKIGMRRRREVGIIGGIRSFCSSSACGTASSSHPLRGSESTLPFSMRRWLGSGGKV